MRTPTRERSDSSPRRVGFVLWMFVLAYLVVLGRLFFIQVIASEQYKELADKQHLKKTEYEAVRGEIFARDHTNRTDSAEVYPLAANKTFYEVYLDPSKITQPENTTDELVNILGVDKETILPRAKKTNDIYEPVMSKATEEQMNALQALDMPGVHWRPETWRYYPDKEIGSHILGFLGIEGERKAGKYGLEGYWDKELSGISQEVVVARDRSGSIIPETDQYYKLAVDGSDIVLTIDRTIQYEACTRLKAQMEHQQADSASLVIMESATGKILSMCSFPAFDPNDYRSVKNVDEFNNSVVFESYEPGSVFKPIAMSVAIDQGKVLPTTIYEDKGEVEIAGYTIRNFDRQAHGVRTMTEVLRDSLNLGMIFATKGIPNRTFYEYVQRFGFGEKTNIDTSQEVAGNLGNLHKFQDIYKATASFGQGISVTPLQMVTAINTLANGGVLMKPYIVDEVRTSDGSVIKTSPKQIRQVVKKETADTVAAMMVRVLDEGYDKKGSVNGYYLAGKTGTAQIAEGKGYGEKTNHTFVGFGPVGHPKFTVLIKMHNVKRVGFAADSTTPLFHDIAEYLLNYYKIPPER